MIFIILSFVFLVKLRRYFHEVIPSRNMISLSKIQDTVPPHITSSFQTMNIYTYATHLHILNELLHFLSSSVNKSI